MAHINPESILPLKPTVFYILLALGRGQMHGYAIMQEIKAFTEDKVRVGPGTLYRSIKQMVDDGLIEEIDTPASSTDDERRRYYRLTEFGQGVVRAELRRLASLVALPQAQHLMRREG
jgi:DNA-binding PadR family transcriptional regulator